MTHSQKISARTGRLIAQGLALAGLLGLSQLLWAQQPPYHRPGTPPPPSEQKAQAITGWSWSGHVDHVNLDAEAANSAHIADSAVALGFAGEYYSDQSEMTLSLGMSALLYNDNDEFSQYVRDSWGYYGTSESEASALMLFAEYGPKYRLGADHLGFAVVRIGASGILGSERSIPNCSNCYSEDIDIEGGVYGVIGVGRTLGSFDLGLQFQQYFSGDIDNSIRLKISGSF